MWIIGIDLAWGDRKPDGVCILDCRRKRPKVDSVNLTHGDEAIMELVRERRKDSDGLLAVDAPLVCPNVTGGRPVDRQMHRIFHREHAGCHPANATRCARPPRLMRRLSELGVRPGWAPVDDEWVAMEVYPHATLVRWFQLRRIIKYKRGRVAAKRASFAQLQQLLLQALSGPFAEVDFSGLPPHLLSDPWTKNLEDQVDGLICALMGWWDWRYQGERSETVGDQTSGFIRIPGVGFGFDIPAGSAQIMDS